SLYCCFSLGSAASEISTLSYTTLFRSGPRPGLWNQDLLIAERDKYGANDVRPGLTGWAQINGRDELEIPEKAKLDGEYVKKLGRSEEHTSELQSRFDLVCRLLLEKKKE